MSIEIVRTVAALRATLAGWRAAGDRIAVVPTMGALHAGHLALVAAGRERAERVVATLFVNPRQFAPTEDLATYPRDEAGDVAKLAGAGCHLVYAPDGPEMYPDGFATSVTVAGGLTDCLCGRSRPHFFGGVATVVSKLLIQSWPDFAMFGEKDYQQLLVVRRMARDLDIPAEIVGVPIVRDADGLALSSRNAYLSAAERAAAPELHRSLAAAAAAIAAGEPSGAAVAAARARLEAAGFAVDYLELRDAGTLAEPDGATGPLRLFAAAWLGRTRLIDNHHVMTGG